MYILTKTLEHKYQILYHEYLKFKSKLLLNI